MDSADFFQGPVETPGEEPAAVGAIGEGRAC